MKQTATKSVILGGVMGASLLATGFAMAEDSPFSANVSLTNNYLYRGITQSGANPAIQGGFDYAHDSGAYAGVWASSISWLEDAGVAANAGTEIDTYLGFSGEAGDIGYDVGFLRYNYPGDYAAGATKANTNEVYGSVTYSIVTAKASYSTGDLFGFTDSKGSTYLELNASYELADAGVTLDAHVGKQKIKNSSDFDYTDYNIGVSKDFSGYGVSLVFSKTTADKDFWTDAQGNEMGKGAFVISLSRSL